MNVLILRVVCFLTGLIYGCFVHGCEPVYMFDTDNSSFWEFDEAVEVIVKRNYMCTPAAKITVDIVSDRTNATESDFSQRSVSVDFNDGDTEAGVIIDIIDDLIIEQLEVITLSIQHVENGTTVSPNSIEVFIVDNDGLNKFSLEKSSYQTLEDSNVISVTVVRKVAYVPNLPAPLGSVTLKTIRHTASHLNDYAAIENKNVVFQPGQNQRKVDVFLVNDAAIEQDESFRVVLFKPTNGFLGDVTEATIEIIDDDSSFNIESSSYKVLESEGSFEIVVVRNGNLTKPGAVRLRKESGSAKSGEDYPIEVLMIEFPSGVSSVPVQVKIINDNHVETPITETFFVELVTAEQGSLSGIIRSNVTITDDDSSFSIISSIINGREQERRVIVTVVREGNTDIPATVYLRTISANRTRRQVATDDDFVPIDELAITFQRGQSSYEVNVELVDDSTAEHEKHFSVILYLKDDDENNEIGEVAMAQINIFDDEIFDDEQDFIRLGSNLFTAFENKGSVRIPIIRKGSNQHTCIIRFSTRPVGAGSPGTTLSDYTPVNKIIEFRPYVTGLNVDIDIEDDTIAEDIETFEVFLSDAFGCGIQEVSSARVDIYDNDMDSVLFRLSSPEYTVLENEGDLMVEVIRYGDLQELVSVYIRTINDGTANPIADYTPIEERRITFDSEQQSYDLPVGIADDAIMEASQSFHVELFNPNGGRLADDNTVSTVVIIDDDDVVQKPQTFFNFQQTTANVLESAGEVELIILRQNYQLQTAYVTVSVESVLADNGATYSDYEQIASRRIDFGPGVSSYTLVVPVLDDSIPESKEIFRVRLSEPISGVLGNDAEVEVYIIDDDCTFTLSEDEYGISEDTKSLRIGVVRTGYNQRLAHVGLKTLYIGDEAQLNDLVTLSETVQFPAGRDSAYVDIRIIDDEIQEGSEKFRVSLYDPVNGVLGNPSTAEVVIFDDDSTGSTSKDHDLSIPVIIYGVVGGVAGVAVLIILIVCVACCMMMTTKNADRPVSIGMSAYGGKMPRPAPGVYTNYGYRDYY